MHRALWLLLGLQLRGSLRFARRNMSSVRGILLLVLGLFVFLSWVGSMIVNPSASGRPDPEQLERFGPLGLLGLCVVYLLFSTGERVITFRPAEVEFLFPGPFTRRQLLGYKVAGIVGATLYQALFILIFLNRWGENLLLTYLGTVLLLLFFQFFTLTLNMLGSTIGARAYSRGRKILLAAVGLLAAALVWRALREEGGLSEALGRLVDSPAWKIGSAPLYWFIMAARADALWPTFATYGALALLVNLVLITFVFILDAEYLEASAAASERHYQRLQRLRSGQGVLGGTPRSGRARFSLPMLPRLGGVGPNVWRHGLVVIRSYLPLLLLLGLGTMAVAMGLGRMGRETHGGLILAGMLIAAPVFLTPSVLCDFRGDVDRLDVLKALPLRPIFLAVGEILAPSLVVVAVQAVAAGILQAILGRIEPGLIAVPLLALPVNFLLFAIENLLFLLFPIRMVASGPGDFQTTGRHMLMFFGKFLCLAPVAFVALLAGWLVYWLTASLVAGVGVAWIILLVSGIALLPLVVLAFDRFDVARDTPV